MNVNGAITADDINRRKSNTMSTVNQIYQRKWVALITRIAQLPNVPFHNTNNRFTWESISSNANTTWNVIASNPIFPWDWSCISAYNPNITQDIIEANPECRWDWYHIIRNPSISLTYVETHPKWIALNTHNKYSMWIIAQSFALLLTQKGARTLPLAFALKWLTDDAMFTVWFDNWQLCSETINEDIMSQDLAHLPWDFDTISNNSNLLITTVMSHPDKQWNWDALSRNTTITWDFVQAHPDIPWHWRNLSGNAAITWDIIQAHPDIPWNWQYISGNPNVTWDIIQSHPDIPWDWQCLSDNPNITWDIIQSHPNIPWSWNYVSENPNITLDIVQAHPDIAWNWEIICQLTYKKQKDKYALRCLIVHITSNLRKIPAHMARYLAELI